jgi:predicted permease
MALAVSAGLLEQSLWSVRGQDPGFVVDRVVVMGVTLSGPPDAAPARVVASERRLTDAIAAVPGTSSVAVAYDHPLAANWRDSFALAGRLPGQDDVAGSAELRIVSPGYLKTMGVEVVDGRELVETDDLDAPGAVLVNEAFVRRAGAGPVLNRRIRSRTPQFNWGPGMPDEFRVVGIVEDERFRGLEHPAEPAVYMSTRQFPQRDFAMLVRTAGDPQAAMSALRAAVRAIDPAAAIGRVRTLDAILREQLAERHMTTGVINGFAGAALALAVLGLYGLLILLVAGRMRETGIRIALGASPSAMVRQIVGTSVATAAIGVAAGILLALAAGSLLESLLVGISARDVTTVVVVSVLLLIVAAVTALPPARRAARIDPAIVLRGD